MSYGNGTIEKRGKGRWRLTWYVDGERRREHNELPEARHGG